MLNLLNLLLIVTVPSAGEKVTFPAATCWQSITVPTAKATLPLVGTVTAVALALPKVTSLEASANTKV
jgi:hypothetical protein